MQTLLQKLASRKFWVALLGVAASVIGSMTSTNAAVQLVLTIAGALTTIVWLIVEGKCDWTAIQSSATAVISAVGAYENTTNNSTSSNESVSNIGTDTEENSNGN